MGWLANMLDFLFDYFSPPPPPVTYGASLLYPNMDVASDRVVVGFVQDPVGYDHRIYMEYGTGAEKYFMIYKGNSSRQVRRPHQPDFLTTGEEFDGLKNDSERYCIYLLDRLQASRLFQKLDDIFFKRNGSNDERGPAYATTIEDMGCQPIVQSTYLEREAVQLSLARLVGVARFGRDPNRINDATRAIQPVAGCRKQ